jgi:colanic acid biosynthesis glycosyl transferase WcaI
MKILIICPYFPPEYTPIGIMMKELAEDLKAHGHTITVITGFPNHPKGIVFAGYRQRLFQRDMDNGVGVIRCYMFVSPRRTAITRILSYLSFGLTSLLAALRLPRQDAVLLPSPPLSSGALALALWHIRKQPYVFNVQDIFPDAAITAGVIANPAMINALRWFEDLVYRRASRVTVISEGFRSNLTAKGVPQPKIEVIYNWLDTGEIAPQPRDNGFSRRHGLNGRFVVLYSGTIGLISGAEILVECAARLRAQPEILFLFVGEGVAKDAIMREAQRRGLGNMAFLPFQARNELPALQSSSDLSVVTLRPGQGRTSVPSKVLGYMAAAKPVLASVDADSDTRSLIEAAACGVWTPPGDHAALADAILGLYHDRPRCARLGRNGREFLLQHCERGAATRQYERLLRSVGQGTP